MSSLVREVLNDSLAIGKLLRHESSRRGQATILVSLLSC